MLAARTYSISIDRNWQALYDAIWQPGIFAKWASGLAQSALRQEGDRWITEGPDGAIAIRFTPRNPFGVMDHVVEVPDGSPVVVPMRVIPNGEGAEVLLTLFRQPGMTDEMFARDAKWMTRDLRALKAFVMGESPPPR